ncbi:hypothetical protein [Novosphingobium sp. ST904]|uniref:hypothetical protein n=1 Tax=Novosphingobium sp. ST904 TaxID=1684385 RepID=UPI0014053822|nr:hypothetical protein [Novosphingobium sp. ST904]
MFIAKRGGLSEEISWKSVPNLPLAGIGASSGCPVLSLLGPALTVPLSEKDIPTGEM